MHDVFLVLLLEQDTTRKEHVNKNAVTQLKFEVGNNEGYELEEIRDSEGYAKESEVGHLSGLYYLVSWKNYPK